MGKWIGFSADITRHKGFTPYYDQPLPYDLTPEGEAALDEEDDGE